MKRRFLHIICSVAAIAASAQSTLYYNGRIRTGDPSTPDATYLVVDNGVITKTGVDLNEVNLNDFANKVDLKFREVLPGIVDSHIHFIDGGLGMLQSSFYAVNEKEALLEKIRSSRDDLIDGMYIGRDLGYEPLADVTRPKDLLDELMPTIPTFIFMKSGHAAIVNSAALKKLGFTKSTSLAGGTIQTDQEGNLTGYLLESAAMEASRFVSNSYSRETIQKAILKIQSRALSYGITTIGDNTFNPYFYKIYQELQKSGLLKIRVRARSFGQLDQTEGLMKGVGRKHLGFIGGGVDPSRVKYHAMKFFEDQSLSMSAHEDQLVVPGGKVFLDEKQLEDIFKLHPSSTFAFHVQGKTGIQNILNAVRDFEAPSERKRHIIDHAGYTTVQQMEEAGKLGLGVTIIAGQMFDYKRLSSFYKAHDTPQFQFHEEDLLNARVKYEKASAALTSDYPYGMDTLFVNYPQIDGLNPFPLMAVNVTGRYPNGELINGVENKTIGLQEGIVAYTANGAHVLNEDHTLGKIAPGYFADFVVMKNVDVSSDPFDWYNAKVAQTYIMGERVYDELGSETATPAKTLKVGATDYAISPVIGYDPTLGMILGAAYFRFPLKTPGRYFDVQWQTISGGKVNIQSTYTHFDLVKNATLTLTGSYSDFFQYYFGEGNSTFAGSYSKIYANTYKVKPELTVKLGKKLQLGSYVDLRGRRETVATDKNGNDLNKVLFPNENTAALGLTLKQDSRDNVFSTRKGTLKQLNVLYIPSAWNVSGLGDVAQITGEVRHFTYVGNSNFVIASRLAAGFSAGTPSYLFRFSMGGPYALRGYYTNRFRGEKYYVGQLEARFPIYKLFSGAAFLDAGDITDQEFIKPKYTYGAGLRVALSQNIKLRLDYGVAKDQRGVFFTFSEAF